MLVLKIETRIVHNLIRGIPLLDEFCIIYTRDGDLNVFCKNAENTMAVVGAISGGIFDYLVANDLSFAINLIKLRKFIGGIDHTERLEAVLDEDRGYLTLKSGPLLRELRYLSPGTVDMDIVDFPDSSEFFRVPDIGEMAVISQGLDQVGDRTLIRLGEKKIQFLSGDKGDVFKYTSGSDETEDRGIEIEVMTKHLVTIGEHLASGGKCDLYIRENSPVLIENPVGPGTRVLYLMAHVA